MTGPNLTPELTPQSTPAVRLTMVITLQNGVQLRASVKTADVRKNSVNGTLNGVDWVLDDDPFGNSIAYVDMAQVVAVHFERAPRQPTLDDLS